jgi:hypothetical protein
LGLQFGAVCRWRYLGFLEVDALARRGGNTTWVCHAGLAGGLEGALGRAGLFAEQAGLLGRLTECVVDLDLVEDAAGDQGVEIAGGAPELVVAAASGRGGDGGGLLF